MIEIMALYPRSRCHTGDVCIAHMLDLSLAGGTSRCTSGHISAVSECMAGMVVIDVFGLFLCHSLSDLSATLSGSGSPRLCRHSLLFFHLICLKTPSDQSSKSVFRCLIINIAGNTGDGLVLRMLTD